MPNVVEINLLGRICSKREGGGAEFVLWPIVAVRLLGFFIKLAASRMSPKIRLAGSNLSELAPMRLDETDLARQGSPIGQIRFC